MVSSAFLGEDEIQVHKYAQDNVEILKEKGELEDEFSDFVPEFRSHRGVTSRHVASKRVIRTGKLRLWSSLGEDHLAMSFGHILLATPPPETTLHHL